MPRGTSPSERGQINKKRKTDYLNSQLSKLQSKLKNTTDAKSKQRLKQSISSIKKQLDTKPKSYIRSKYEKVKTSRGLKVRPKKTEKTSTIRKVKYPVYKGKVEEKKKEEKKTSTVGPVSDGKKYSDSLGNKKIYKKVSQKELDAKIAEGKKSQEKPKKAKKEDLKIKKGSARNFIKTKKGMARRGTAKAKRAEERERRRKALAAKGYMKNR